MDGEALYKKCVDFHGHACGGLLIGFRAALAAMEEFKAQSPAADEEIVCVAENDACGVDAIQALLGCTVGKGNLIFRLRGKQAFNFFDRHSGKSFRIALKEKDFKTKEEKEFFMRSAAAYEIFDKSEARFDMPQKAPIYKSRECALCGERAAEPYLRVKDGKILCLDCLRENQSKSGWR